MESIVSLNNQGVIFFQLRRLEEASNSFRIAALGLNVVKETNSHHYSSQDEDVHSSSRDFNPILGWSSPVKFTSTLEGTSIMFTRALLLKNPLPKDFSNETQPFLQYLDVVALSLLYNSAVLNHVYSDSNGQISKAADAAYHAYEQSFVISQRIGLAIDDKFAFHLKVLKLALFNNMGVLYHNCMCRFEDASQCFKSSRRLMHDLEKTLIASEIMTSEEVIQLSMNVVVVLIAAAPAA